MYYMFTYKGAHTTCALALILLKTQTIALVTPKKNMELYTQMTEVKQRYSL